jgi:tRNA A-37 threonylcarbamoyl transferase component Bud32
MYDAPMGIVWDQRLMTAWFVLLLGYSVVSYIVLALNYRRLRDVNERRRVRAVVPSIVVTWILSFHLIVVTNWAALFPTPAPPFFSVAMVSIDSVLLIIPALLFAYAIVRHRVFNLSVVIRRGLQYALARRMVVSLLPATMALLLVDAAVHRDQTFGEIASRRGWLYAGVGSVALVGRRRQQQWLDALDRQFFRERYHAEQILRAVAEEIRHAASIEQAAGRVAARIEAAVHPEFVAVLVRAPNEVAYHALAVSPPDMPPPILHAETKLVGLLRLLDKPLQLGTADSDWLARQLPRDETVFLQRSRVDLLIPISLPPFGREALLVLGQKKSEEPYGTDDQELLLAIANGLAVLLERPLTGTVAAKGDEQPRVLGGRYRLDHLLGRGGMGAVYSALDMTLERHVAIKLVRDDLLTSAEAADRFRREAKAAAALAHPNIVTLHDFAVDADRAFLVMELLRGTTLRHELRRGRMLSTSRMFEVVRGLCAALTYAHGRGIVHRDLKPENVFLISDGTEVIPKILDFGLAKVIVSSEAVTQATIGTGIGVFVGTPKYMSPEQMRGLPVSPQWDVWAVSVMIYEMLIGAYPFGNVESFAALQERIIDGRFTPVNQVSTDAPESWQKFFVALLNAESSRRPATAMQLLTECELLKSDL